MNRLSEKRIAALMTDGFEQAEFFSPMEALEKEGAIVEVISLQKGEIKAWDEDDWGKAVPVDVVVAEADPDRYDALLLPGGVMNPDKIRNDERAVAFVKQFTEQGKPVAAICHGPWTLINAGAVKGRTMTSYPSLQVDLRNAGANWVGQSVVVDNGIVTSRNPGDLNDFNAAMIEVFSGKGLTTQSPPQENAQTGQGMPRREGAA